MPRTETKASATQWFAKAAAGAQGISAGKCVTNVSQRQCDDVMSVTSVTAVNVDRTLMRDFNAH